MANFHFCFKFTLKRSPFSNHERRNFATGPSFQILLVGTEFLACSLFDQTVLGRFSLDKNANQAAN